MIGPDYPSEIPQGYAGVEYRRALEDMGNVWRMGVAAEWKFVGQYPSPVLSTANYHPLCRRLPTS